MIKKIDNFKRNIKDEDVYFVIIVDRVAWYWDFGGQRYGDFMDLRLREVAQYSTTLIDEIVKILAKQAKATITEIKCKKQQSQEKA